jgi:chromosome partitioning protein
MKRTSIWMFGNNKGGVGKTTISLNAAASVSEAGKSCIFIDIDESTNSTFHLRLEDSTERCFPVNRLFIDEHASVEDCILWHTKLPNVALIPSERGIREQIAQYVGNQSKAAIREMGRRFAEKLQELDGVVDYIIIDVGPSMDSALSMALEAVTHYMFVADASSYAEQGIMNMMDSVPRLQPGEEDGIELVGAVYSNINMNSGFAKTIVNRKHLAGNRVELLPVYVPHRVEVYENQTNKEFAVKPGKETILAQSFRDLTFMMMEKVKDGYPGAEA